MLEFPVGNKTNLTCFGRENKQKIKQSCPSDRLFNSHYGIMGFLESAGPLNNRITQTLTKFLYHSGLTFPSSRERQCLQGPLPCFLQLFTRLPHKGPSELSLQITSRDSSDSLHKLPLAKVHCFPTIICSLGPHVPTCHRSSLKQTLRNCFY